MHHLCVQELLIRGMRHQSPVSALWFATVPARRQFDIYIPVSRMTVDAQDLMRKAAQVEASAKSYDCRINVRSAGTQLVHALSAAVRSGFQDAWLYE
jgi:hypothetical protein